MKKVMLLLLLPYLLLAQYISDGAAEKYYENSSLHFNSNYLNPYGISGFTKVAKGLIQDPLMKLQVNPAFIPGLDSMSALIYFDFRGDKTKPEYVEDYTIMPVYSMFSSYIPPYYPGSIYEPRTEPEPLFSIGTYFKPLKGVADNLVMGITYQMIQGDEPYYALRNPVFYRAMYNDAFGNKVVADDMIPTVDRQSGKNEMGYEAHLYSLYAGYQLNPEIAIALTFSGVQQDRNGAYGNASRSEFGTVNENPYAYSDFDERSMKYHHTDISAGLLYQPKQAVMLGIKAGYLNGVSEQSFNKENTGYNQYHTPEVDTHWNYYSSLSHSQQNWKHDGSSFYGGCNFEIAIPDNRTLSGYYEYRDSKEDVTNSTTILDSMYSTYRSTYYYNTMQWYTSKSRSLTTGIRNATGEKKNQQHDAMISMRWQVSDATNISLGFRFFSLSSNISTTEPVLSNRTSSWQYSSNQVSGNQSSQYALKEDKTLLWNYDIKEWTLSIPLLFEQRFSSFLGCIVGVSREISSKKIEEQTLAIFKSRVRTENGQTTTETNFGERYTEPTEKTTKKEFDMFFGLNVNMGRDVKVTLLLNPESDPILRVAQWSLGCSVKL